MSGPYYDVYALCSERTATRAQRFLDEWAPARVASSADPYPTDQVPAVSEGLYWESGRSDEIEHVMLFSTSDGGMIAGLSISDWQRPRSQIARIFFRLSESVGARFGYVTAEEAPVCDTEAAFRAECTRRELALIDGERVGLR